MDIQEEKKPSWEPSLQEEEKLQAEDERLKVRDLFRVFLSPSSVFERFPKRGTVLLPLLALCVVLSVLGIWQQSHVDLQATFERISQEHGIDMEMYGGAAGTFSQAITYATLPIGILISTILVAGAFAASAYVAGAEGPFARIFGAVVVACWPPWVVRSVLLSLILLSTGKIAAQDMQYLLKSNPAALLGGMGHTPLGVLLSMLDLFLIWQVALIAIAFRKVGKLSKPATTLAVAVPLTAWIALKLLLVALIPSGF